MRPSDGAVMGAISGYRDAIGREALTEFRIDALDRVGLPVVATWVSDPATGWRGGGIGYGTDEDRATVGALGETLESLACHRGARLARPLRSSFAELVRAQGAGAVVDPRLLGLPAGTEWSADRPHDWVRLRRWRPGARDGEAAWVPVEFTASSPGDLSHLTPPPGGWLIRPVTNGLGAGVTRDQAVQHAVGEILQRDGNGLRFRALDAGVVVDLTGLDDGPTQVALAALRAAGVETTVKLASTGDGVVNVYAVGRAVDDDVIVATACGEAADADPVTAVRKAVLEFASARSRKAFMHGGLDEVRDVAPDGYLDDVLPGVDVRREEQRVLESMVAWTRWPADEWRPLLDATVFARRRVVPFADARPGPPADLDVLVADLPAGAMAAVKVVVPGHEVETVAYGRIGERNTRRLVEGGRDDLVRIGRQPPGWAAIALTPQARERLGGPAWLDRDALDRVTGPLLPLYREPGRHAVAVALGAALRERLPVR